VDWVTIRELRRRGGQVIDRVEDGETIVIIRDGDPMAELRPLRPFGLTAASLLERWRRVPFVDPERLRSDIDTVIDQRWSAVRCARRAHR
jgi:prevent-host-death family protein